MAGNAVIGALRVNLGLDTAQFTTGLQAAQGKLASFGKTMAVSLTAASAAIGAAFGIAAKNVIDGADAMSKSAQKAGVATDALSRLAYAAKYSDVSLEDLTGSLGRLAKTMAEAVATPTSTAATAFKALGINITDASGKLRPADEVFTQIADRFSRLEDGSTKTALAMELFGKSGAQLIPLLNGGATGLKQMADESDRLGLTISTKTGQAAERFNDTMTKIGATFEGIVTQLATALLPTLQSFADAIAKADPGTTAAAAAIAGIGTAASLAAPGVNLLTGAVTKLYGAIALIAALPAGVLTLAGAAFLGSTEPLNVGEDALVQRRRDAFNASKVPTPWLGSGFGITDLGDTSFASKTTGMAPPVGTTSKDVAALNLLGDGLDTVQEKFASLADTINGELHNAVSGFVDEIMSGVNPLKAFADQLLSIAKDFASAAIKNGLNALLSGLNFGGSTPSPFRFGGYPFAGGGQVSGPGTGTSDSIPAMLSDGEYVVNATATKKFRSLLDGINFGGISRLAVGGPVFAPTGESDRPELMMNGAFVL